jgi:hypothetical protein
MSPPARYRSSLVKVQFSAKRTKDAPIAETDILRRSAAQDTGKIATCSVDSPFPPYGAVDCSGVTVWLHCRGFLCAHCQTSFAKVAGLCVECEGVEWSIVYFQIFSMLILAFGMLLKSTMVVCPVEQAEDLFKDADEDVRPFPIYPHTPPCKVYTLCIKII